MHEPPRERTVPDRDGRRLEKWVEPEIEVLDIKETALFPRTGGDGGLVGPDCTRS
jgi:hypothetical protein